MNLEQILNVLSSVRLPSGRLLHPDPIIVNSIRAEIEAALSDTSAPNPNRAAAEIYEEHVSKFGSHAAAVSDALSKIQSFRKQADVVAKAESQLAQARSEMDNISATQSRVVAIGIELDRLETNLRDLNDELKSCSPDTIQAVRVSAADELLGWIQRNDIHARGRYRLLLEIMIQSDEHRAVTQIAIKAVTKQCDALKAEKADLEDQLAEIDEKLTPAKKAAKS
jgi:polyhydroxyalkanoate synthesis regulator phasin